MVECGGAGGGQLCALWESGLLPSLRDGSSQGSGLRARRPLGISNTCNCPPPAHTAPTHSALGALTTLCVLLSCKMGGGAVLGIQ